MAAGYLLDTNAIIDFSVERLPGKAQKKIAFIIDDSHTISIVNKIELLSSSHVLEQIVAFAEQAHIILLDDEIVEKTINIRKKYKTKLPDTIIAATAIVNQQSLITHNVSDFKNIKELKVLDSYSLG